MNGPAWSLFFELIINLVFAAWLVRIRATWLWFIAGIAGAFLLVAAIAYGTLNIGWSWDKSWAGLSRVIFSFTIGILIRQAKFSLQGESIVFILPILLLLSLMVFPIDPTWRFFFDGMTALLIAPTLLIVGILFQPPYWLRKTCEFLGDISYPLYAIHFPLLFIVGYAARKMAIGPVFWIPAFLTGLIIFSWLLGKFIDPPLRRLLVNLATSHRRGLQVI